MTSQCWGVCGVCHSRNVLILSLMKSSIHGIPVHCLKGLQLRGAALAVLGLEAIRLTLGNKVVDLPNGGQRLPCAWHRLLVVGGTMLWGNCRHCLAPRGLCLPDRVPPPLVALSVLAMARRWG